MQLRRRKEKKYGSKVLKLINDIVYRCIVYNNFWNIFVKLYWMLIRY